MANRCAAEARGGDAVRRHICGHQQHAIDVQGVHGRLDDVDAAET